MQGNDDPINIAQQAIRQVDDHFHEFRRKFPHRYIIMLWDINRYRICSYIQDTLVGWGSRPSMRPKKRYFTKIKQLASFLYVNHFLNPQQGEGKRVLVIDHSRKSYSQDPNVSGYVKYVISRIEKNNKILCFVSNISPQENLLNLRGHFAVLVQILAPSRFNLFWTFYVYLFGTFIFRAIHTLWIRKQFYNHLIMATDQPVSWQRLSLTKFSIIFFIKEAIALRYLSHCRINELVIVTAYTRAHWISAARKLNVQVSEPQHGVINEFHNGYNNPYSSQLSPDCLLVWGPFWRNQIANLMPNTRKVICKSPLNRSISKSNHTVKSILFLDQGIFGSSIVDLAVATAEMLPGRKIIYRPHPADPRLDNTQQYPPNFCVDQGTLHKTFALTSHVIGVSSTALFEAAAYGKQLIILKLPGWIYMKRLIERYNIPLVDSSKEIRDQINRAFAEDVQVPAEDLFI